jgi:outer membrane receptor protein involved in Fe transport
MLSDAIPSIKGKYINYLKLRGTFAKTGTVNIGNYELQNLASPASGYPYGSLSSYVVSTNIRNPGIQPEFTTEFEFGVELGLLKDRIILEAAAYQQTTNNQTVPVSMPYSSGYANMYLNAGEMRGRGVEVDLKLTPLFKIGDLRWNFNAVFTMAESIVTAIYGDMNELVINSSYGNFSATVGKPYPWFKASDWLRDDEGRVIVSPTTGYPSVNSVLQDMGTTTPKYKLGLGSRLVWKNFTLNMTAEYRGGNIARFTQETDMLFQGTSVNSAEMGRQRFVIPNSVYRDADGSYKPNTNITVSSGGRDFFAATYRSTAAPQIVSGASWRIRELSLAYTIPDNFVAKTKLIQRASVSLVSRNLALWLPKTNKWGDPDAFSTGDNNLTGYQGQGRSLPRTLGFNLSVTF